MKIRICIFVQLFLIVTFLILLTEDVFADDINTSKKDKYTVVYIDETKDADIDEDAYENASDSIGLYLVRRLKYRLNEAEFDFRPSAKIGSNEKDNEIYDVAKGIPTDEDLYADVKASSFVIDLDYNLNKVTGVHLVTVSKSYHLTWYPDGKDKPASSAVETVSKTYKVIVSSMFFTIDKVGVYMPDRVELSSPVFEGAKLSIDAAEELGADVEIVKHQLHVLSGKQKHLSVTAPSSSIVGGKTRPSVPAEDFSGLAEAEVSPPYVRNDKFIFNGHKVMVDKPYTSMTPIPNFNFQLSHTDDKFFYKDENTIPMLTQNGLKDVEGQVIYKALIDGGMGEEKAVEIEDINTVFVHSPVVAFPTCKSRTDIVQREEIDETLTQLVIGDSFKLNFPYEGQHRNIKGYGNRSYESSTRKREVRFPFDVFRGENKDGQYFSKNTWIEVKEDVEEYFIPEWVAEKDRDRIACRAVANNYTSNNSLEKNHNLSHNNYRAVEVIDVALTSKIFDFQIDASKDPAFKTHFSTGKGYFKAGDKDEFGKEEKHSNYLPMTGYKLDDKRFQGRHMKLGYKFSFSFKTSGDMFNKDDIVVISPTYKLRTPRGRFVDVDLYYELGDDIVSIDYKMKNYFVLNRADRRLREDELKNTAKVYKLKDEEDRLSYEDYYKRLARKKSYNIQYRDKLVLGHKQRTYIGEYEKFKEIEGLKEADLLASVQKWYGDFYLPASTLVVKKGTRLTDFRNLDTKKRPFIQRGFLIVGFKIDVYHNIESADEIKGAKPYISYTTKKWGNQWKREGFKLTQPFGEESVVYRYGDVAIYDISKKAYDNYK